MKPIIGITVECLHDPVDGRTRGKLTLNWNYAEVISEAGGVPIVIPPTADIESVVPLLDGWLIPGGYDIDASNWGEPNHPNVELQDPSRFAFERELFRRADPQMPVLGICYGCQFLNVVRGGSLVQHVPDVVGSNTHSEGALAMSEVEPGSKLAQAVGAASVEGRSYHHQAVGRLGEGLKVTARHSDGTAEAIEAEDRPWMLGVQWHPERHLDEASLSLFRVFIDNARAFHALKAGQGVTV